MLGIGDDPFAACCKAFAKSMASRSETPVFADTETQEKFVGGTGECTSVVSFTSGRTRSTWPAMASRSSTLNVVVDRSTASFKAFTLSTMTWSEPPVCADTETWEPTAESTGCCIAAALLTLSHRCGQDPIDRRRPSDSRRWASVLTHRRHLATTSANQLRAAQTHWSWPTSTWEPCTRPAGPCSAATSELPFRM